MIMMFIHCEMKKILCSALIFYLNQYSFSVNMIMKFIHSEMNKSKNKCNPKNKITHVFDPLFCVFVTCYSFPCVTLGSQIKHLICGILAETNKTNYIALELGRSGIKVRCTEVQKLTTVV